jgi:hypothetical protein
MELMVGLSVAATLGLITAMLVKAGFKTYLTASRQTAALQSGSAALKGNASHMGLITAARGAVTVSGLSTSDLILVSTSGATTSFFISTNTLRQVPSTGASYTLASDASGLTVSYYNMSSAGLIIQSTVDVNATLVTALLSVKGVNNGNKTYYFYGGAKLRNHN